MSDKTVTPVLGAKSFTCPHCGAVAHQSWFRVFAHSYAKKDEGPYWPEAVAVDAPKTVHDFVQKMWGGKIFKEHHEYGGSSNWELVNLSVNLCYSCNEWSVWVAQNIVFPATHLLIEPNTDMPADVQTDFAEANAIIGKSPRGAAALLRLCIQKLMPHLGQKGKNIDHDIGALVKNGLDIRIQKALDIVRVIGNNAVHPGQIDLRDDKATAFKLFNLVNLIVAAMITAPKHIEELYGALPETALEAIEKRDNKETS
jgi:hypothetical protein